MDILIHNPIAHMYGPHFLVLYASVIAITLGWCAIILRDVTVNLPAPLVPTQPDPYEIAYLRGGATQVLHLISFDLIQRGYLKVDGNLVTVGWALPTDIRCAILI